MEDLLSVTTTTEGQVEAQALARALVELRLAACVQVVGPIESTYWWEGEVQEATEWLCVAKTTRDRFAELRVAIQRLHTYDEPQIIATPITAGSEGYLAWLRAAVE
ncbi:MAG: divalent cation tolerance protein CutA [Planctomycetales bacterium]|nr:divalent cation tolerance protein CutA [Planctomycetales bacterium]NIM09136.1 divalent cation tolerance protein CutA [Planctomycetales bacterium]NIN08603.1 divalent cation tolerance protein CutA [Planctomycetales bacterium]NIN77729.1 divalent cation tolerance protein CutA [Planctomycetales bacterium]NIO34901.1 divalent cation tolerance protein CutA [Planctomycetales bacterium]